MHSPFDFPDPEWTDISIEAKDFVSHLLEKDPSRRYTAAQALEHAWLSGIAPSARLARIDSFRSLLSDYNYKRKVIAKQTGGGGSGPSSGAEGNDGESSEKVEDDSDEALITNGLVS